MHGPTVGFTIGGQVASGAFFPLAAPGPPVPVFPVPNPVAFWIADNAKKQDNTAPADGDGIATLLDTSGKGRNLSQGSAALRPKLVLRQGKNCVKGDGVDDALTGAYTLVGSGGVGTFSILLYSDNPNGFGAFLRYGPNGNGLALGIGQYDLQSFGNNIILSQDGGNTVGMERTLGLGWGVLSWRRYADGITNVYFNTSPLYASFVGLGTVLPGVSLCGYTGTSAARYQSNPVRAVIAYDVPLSQADFMTVIAYMGGLKN